MCYNRQAKATLDGGEGGGGVVTRRRVDRVISLSHNTSIYVFTHALAYHHHPLSDDDDATLQMNPITHQGGRPSPISLRVRVSVSLPLPAADRDFSSGLQWRIGSMDDGRTDGQTDPFLCTPSDHRLSSPFLVLSLESPPSRARCTLLGSTLSRNVFPQVAGAIYATLYTCR